MIKYLKHSFFRKNMLPIYLIFWITARCNSKCQTCFNWRGQNCLDNIEKELAVDEIQRISAKLNDVAWLLLGGGEPFLETQKLVETSKIFYRQNNTRNITISTNATLTAEIIETTKTIMDECPGLNLVITLSLDGIGQNHDKIRGYKGNFDRFVKTCKALERLRSSYPQLSVNLNTVVSNQNIDYLDEIIAFVSTNLKPNFHGFELLRGDPRNPLLTPPPLKEYAEKLKLIKSYWQGLPFYSMGHSRILKATKIIAREIEIKALERKKQIIPCLAGSIAGVVTAAGDVHLCELLSSIGNVRDYNYDFKKLWLSTEANQLRQFIRNKKCYCAHSCFVSSSILFNPLLYPKLIYRGLKA
jgi:MoaA/NifB/PqqE/SkfB family radical SAM enzyme